MSELQGLIFPQVKVSREESLALHRKMLETYKGPIKVQPIKKHMAKRPKKNRHGR